MDHGKGPVRRHLRRTAHQSHGDIMFNRPLTHEIKDSAFRFSQRSSISYPALVNISRSILRPATLHTIMLLKSGIGKIQREVLSGLVYALKRRANHRPLTSTYQIFTLLDLIHKSSRRQPKAAKVDLSGPDPNGYFCTRQCLLRTRYNNSNGHRFTHFIYQYNTNSGWAV